MIKKLYIVDFSNVEVSFYYICCACMKYNYNIKSNATFLYRVSDKFSQFIILILSIFSKIWK